MKAKQSGSRDYEFRAVEQYVQERRIDGEINPQTASVHKRTLARFMRWLDSEGVPLSEVDGDVISRYKAARAREVAQSTLSNEMEIVRQFLKVMADLERAPQGVADKVRVPQKPDDYARKEREIDKERAEQIKEYLAREEPFSLSHALFVVAFESAACVGALHALDVSHFDREERTLRFVHRPSEGLPLKNGADGERVISLSETTARVLHGYIEENRREPKGEGDPLFVSRKGNRMSKSAMRRRIYALSRPCVYAGHCPHGRTQSDCEATEGATTASKCPSSEGPHAVRRGGINALLTNGVSKSDVSERCDVTVAILEKHYRTQSEHDKMVGRRARVMGALDG